MTEFGGVVGGGRVAPTVDGPRLRGHRLVDLLAISGAIVWVAVVLLAWFWLASYSTAELFVCVAVLVLVPLGLGVLPLDGPESIRATLYDVAVLGHLPSALAAVVALSFPIGSIPAVFLAVPWFGVTATLGLVGVLGLTARGIGPIPDLAIDAALLYAPVGAVALLLHQAGISFHFAPIIILLTAVHYHYAGFVLPLVAGLAGRQISDDDGRFARDATGRIAAGATIVIVVNLALIAVGITFSPLIELVAVSLFTVAVAGFALGVLGRVAWTVSGLPGALLALATVSIVATMALALGYGYSAFSSTTQLISISEMIRWHGTVNAFGFALPSLLAFRLLME